LQLLFVQHLMQPDIVLWVSLAHPLMNSMSGREGV
jgi:hypothetical protein